MDLDVISYCLRVSSCHMTKSLLLNCVGQFSFSSGWNIWWQIAIKVWYQL